MGTLPPQIERFLQDFIARRRRLAVGKAAALAVAAGVAIALVACLADRLFQLPAGARAVLLAVDVAAVVLILRRPMLDALAAHAQWVEAARQIETLEPAFAQRLITVTSQLQSPESQRGSPGMLATLIDELTAFTANRQAASLLGWGRIARPLVIAGCLIAISAAAMAVPWLNLPRLLVRFTRPWAAIAPVTTTQLAVEPGHTRLAQGRPLAISVTATKLGDSPVRVFVKEPDGWTRHDLDRTADDMFAIELPPRDRDTQYYVTGGDARSPTYDVQVITVPGLAEVRARVQFPAYLNWPEKSLTLPDGRLDVPAGSEVTLSLVGTEPLADASLTPRDGQPLATEASVDPAVRTIKLAVPRDATLTASLTSRQGVTQAASQPITLKAIPDRPPLVRLLVPETELRLNPTDLLTTACQAMDDYGIESLTLAVKINDRPPVHQPVPISGDRRRIEMTIDCDLAGINVAVGDVIQVQLLAKDGAGQQRGSETIRAVISPRSFDLNAYLRLTDLKNAQKLLAEAQKQLAAARDGLGQPRESIQKDGDRSLQALTAAAQLVHRAQSPLMRAAARADRRELGDALAAWFDDVERTRAMTEAAADLRLRAVEPGIIRAAIDDGEGLLRRSTEQMTAVVKGQAALAVRDDLQAAESVSARVERAQGADREKLENAVRRLTATAEAAAKEVGIDFGGNGFTRPGVDQAIAQAAGALRAQPIEFGDVAAEWAGLLQRLKDPAIPERFRLASLAVEPRLAAAAAIEMVRPDADFNRARDLSLAARAGQNLALTYATRQSEIRDYPAALRDLQAEHRLVRRPQNNADAIRRAAKAARQKMRQWAGEVDPVLADAAASMTDQHLALEAAVAMQQRQFEQARKVESRRTAPADVQQQRMAQLEQAVQAAQQLQELHKQQEQLARQTAKVPASDQARLQQVAKVQQQLAEKIKQARDAAEQAAAGGPDAAAEEREGDRAVEALVDARRSLAELKAANADVRQAKDDAARLDKAKALDPSPVAASSERLASAGAAMDEARKQIDEKVLPEARAIQQDAKANDAGAVGRRSGQLDREIAEALKKLDAAEAKLVERDALAAAESASQQAARQMAQAATADPNATPADRAAAQRSAQEAQARTISALEQSAQRVATAGGAAQVRDLPRLADLFSLLPLLDANVAVAGAGAGFAKADLAVAREWGKLRPREETQQTAVNPPADPAGYESAIRAYFEAMGKEK